MESHLETEFHQEMVKLYEVAKSQYKYNATRFLQKLKKDGGVAAAKMVLKKRKLTSDDLPKGLIAMIDRNALEYTVEATVITDKWRSLFSETEINTAYERLAHYGFKFEKEEEQVVPMTIGEIDDNQLFPEGAKKQIIVNAYERNSKAREMCIEKFGRTCYVCKMSFKNRYGKIAEDYIHVHHLSALSEIGEKYEINPFTDLRPVCPSCHAVIHMRKPSYSIDEVRAMLRSE